MSAQGPGARSAAPSEESASDACQALIHLLQSRQGRGAWAGDDGRAKRSLLIADYAYRSQRLSPSLRAQLDRQVIESFLPGPPQPRPAGLRERRDAETVDLAVLTILREELNAVLAVFGIEEHLYLDFDGQRFYRTEVAVPGLREPLSLVITAAGRPLNVHVPLPVDALFQHFDPKAVFLLGIAGGAAGEVKPGDVLVSGRTMYYPSGRLVAKGEGTILEPRPQYAQTPGNYGHGLFYYDPLRTSLSHKFAEHLAGTPPARLPEGIAANHCPKIFTDKVTIASGDLVLRDGALLSEIRRRFDTTVLGIDEESYGFSQAVHGLPWLIFRGVSDLTEPDPEPLWKPLAAVFAALCLKDFLETNYLPPGADRL